MWNTPNPDDNELDLAQAIANAAQVTLGQAQYLISYAKQQITSVSWQISEQEIIDKALEILNEDK